MYTLLAFQLFGHAIRSGMDGLYEVWMDYQCDILALEKPNYFFYLTYKIHVWFKA